MTRASSWMALTLVLGASCGGEPLRPAKPRPSLLEGAVATPAYVSPATWSYHPPEAATLRARIALRGGRALLAGDRGERWLVDRKKRTARAAARLAPENLIAVSKPDDGAWVFVGESGTTYEASDPLGPFVRSNAPLDPLARVAPGAHQAILGVEPIGRLLRSGDAGASWEQVGPEGTFFVDVALTKQGKALALGWPESLFSSEDSGQTWKPVDRPVGALALHSDERAGLVLVTALSLLRWQPGADAALVPLGRSVRGKSYELPVAPEQGPDAEALVDGRATIFADRYTEVLRDADHEYAWKISAARLGAHPKAVSLGLAERCRSIRLAGYDQVYYLACFERSGSRDTQPVQIFRSGDAGKSWKTEPYGVLGSREELAMAVGQDGQLVVTGICPAQLASRGCKPYGVYYRRLAEPEKSEKKKGETGKRSKRRKPTKKEEPAFELAPAATPTLAGPAERLAFSTDGKLAYAVGRRNKNQAWAVFVSADAGRTFEARELDQLPDSFAEEPEPDRYSMRPRYDQQTQVATLGVAEDGTLAMVFTRYGAQQLVVTDQQGRVLSVAAPPEDRARVGAVGMRALAFSTTSREAWESLDGGASWESIGNLPFDPCEGERECKVPVYCHLGGCVVGSQLSRVGWRGQADDDLGVLSPPEHRVSGMIERKVRAPLSCTLDGQPWRPLVGVARAPDAAQAASGDASWYAVSFDDAHAAVSVFHASGANLEPVTLLAPTTDPEHHALAILSQYEGTAALRYPTVAEGGSRITGVEVAWDDVLHGKRGRARVPDAGVYRPGDYVRRSTRTQLARPALVSIALDGLFLRIHDAPGDAQETLFLDGRRVERVPSVSWPSGASKGSSEMVRIDGTSVPIRRVAADAGLLRAERAGDQWRFDAYAVGLAEPRAFGLDQHVAVAYVDGRPGVNTRLVGRSGSKNVVFPLRASGAVVDPPRAVPLQENAGDRPGRCSSTQLASTPRVVVPYQPGTRHPVVVIDPAEPVRVLLTGSAVMHGTPRAACVAAFDAELVPSELGGEGDDEKAILPLGDLEHSWLFRTVESDTGGEQLEVRRMSCAFDPKLEIPLEVYGQPGTTRAR